ncbi:SRPBCC family protein [Candidatus Laterigemmans baculatus]|uniref:SRPBCC family protein n=1 Tax=Candidatus Laterigemmans baculatus TaxID=2770505 RepID=UPI0013DC2100|nr:SRPBCC family protein [Candidatus Laterigemmans baculatus]
MTSPNESASALHAGGQPQETQHGGGHSLVPHWAEDWSSHLPGRSAILNPPQNISNSERWASTAVGGLLTVFGLLRGKTAGYVAAGAGACLLYRGLTGHCYGYEMLGIDTAEYHPHAGVPAQQGVRVEEEIKIRRAPEQVFAFWRDVENLPQFMRHLKSVDAIDSRRSHWVAEGPLGVQVQWDAEIFNERSGEMIAWRSLPGGDVQTAGSVHFESSGPDGATIVRVSMKYNPPAGKAGEAVASWLGSGLEQQVCEDLEKLKQVLEASEGTAGSKPAAGPNAAGPNAAGPNAEDQSSSGSTSGGTGTRPPAES